MKGLGCGIQGVQFGCRVTRFDFRSLVLRNVPLRVQVAFGFGVILIIVQICGKYLIIGYVDP